MNQLPIPKIKAELKSMYPSYRFEIKSVQRINSYEVTVFKDRKNLSSITVAGKTPMSTFWNQIKEWMRQVIINS